ncbi:translation initiation factor eIF-2B subunit epsilon isoform X2 [Sitodiplosis mosellana]|uniref:translation initiation factor eIF-2B subunit epsilon isoform X2 n=1 Tax=Sitodiplosis mosellana TaxID=263140 RepID=UPI002444099D|nr:translation initiation factor eIF-2B subunit epsilon isoform X2 [Sitodiplosis mosellana]
MKRLDERCTWSIQMTVQVVGSDGCHSLGDALRDLYAKRLLRKHFILLNADTVTNANLFSILQTHIKRCAFDEGTAMTVVFKKCVPGISTGQEVIIANDARTKRLLFHQRVRSNKKASRNCILPLEIFTENSDVELRHDLSDPDIAICAPSVLSLFADNFDFETRDDFIRGLLINEEILASTIYVSELPSEQYAAKVKDWQMYRIVSHDIINRWAYPLVPDMGICSLHQNYMFLRNNVYRSKTVQLANSAIARENVVINDHCAVKEGTELINAVFGKNCKIGRNCVLENAFVFDNVEIGDKCVLKNCVVGKNTKIQDKSAISNGTVIGHGCVIPPESIIAKEFIVAKSGTDEYDEATYKKISEHAYSMQLSENMNVARGADVDSDDESVCIEQNNLHMTDMTYEYESSIYSSSSDGSQSNRLTPVPDDANIFLTEVIDSLERGYKDKTKPDYLILEINSSRYAYNMSLSEVNFYVVKALLNLYPIKEANGNVLTAFNQIFAQLHGVLKNYIRGSDAMIDCLKAIEESCHQNETLKSKIAQIIHFLYDKEIITEESILSWHNELDDDKEWIRNSLIKLIEWLNASSEEEEEEESSSDEK